MDRQSKQPSGRKRSHDGQDTSSQPKAKHPHSSHNASANRQVVFRHQVQEHPTLAAQLSNVKDVLQRNKLLKLTQVAVQNVEKSNSAPSATLSVTVNSRIPATHRENGAAPRSRSVTEPNGKNRGPHRTHTPPVTHQSDPASSASVSQYLKLKDRLSTSDIRSILRSSPNTTQPLSLNKNSHNATSAVSRDNVPNESRGSCPTQTHRSHAPPGGRQTPQNTVPNSRVNQRTPEINHHRKSVGRGPTSVRNGTPSPSNHLSTPSSRRPTSKSQLSLQATSSTNRSAVHHLSPGYTQKESTTLSPLFVAPSNGRSSNQRTFQGQSNQSRQRTSLLTGFDTGRQWPLITNNSTNSQQRGNNKDQSLEQTRDSQNDRNTPSPLTLPGQQRQSLPNKGGARVSNGTFTKTKSRLIAPNSQNSRLSTVLSKKYTFRPNSSTKTTSSSSSIGLQPPSQHIRPLSSSSSAGRSVVSHHPSLDRQVITRTLDSDGQPIFTSPATTRHNSVAMVISSSASINNHTRLVTSPATSYQYRSAMVLSSSNPRAGQNSTPMGISSPASSNNSAAMITSPALPSHSRATTSPSISSHSHVATFDASLQRSKSAEGYSIRESRPRLHMGVPRPRAPTSVNQTRQVNADTTARLQRPVLSSLLSKSQTVPSRQSPKTSQPSSSNGAISPLTTATTTMTTTRQHAVASNSFSKESQVTRSPPTETTAVLGNPATNDIDTARPKETNSRNRPVNSKNGEQTGEQSVVSSEPDSQVIRLAVCPNCKKLNKNYQRCRRCKKPIAANCKMVELPRFKKKKGNSSSGNSSSALEINAKTVAEQLKYLTEQLGAIVNTQKDADGTEAEKTDDDSANPRPASCDEETAQNDSRSPPIEAPPIIADSSITEQNPSTHRSPQRLEAAEDNGSQSSQIAQSSSISQTLLRAEEPVHMESSSELPESDTMTFAPESRIGHDNNSCDTSFSGTMQINVSSSSNHTDHVSSMVESDKGHLNQRLSSPAPLVLNSSPASGDHGTLCTGSSTTQHNDSGVELTSVASVSMEMNVTPDRPLWQQTSDGHLTSAGRSSSTSSSEPLPHPTRSDIAFNLLTGENVDNPPSRIRRSTGEQVDDELQMSHDRSTASSDGLRPVGPRLTIHVNNLYFGPIKQKPCDDKVSLNSSGLHMSFPCEDTPVHLDVSACEIVQCASYLGRQRTAIFVFILPSCQERIVYALHKKMNVSMDRYQGKSFSMITLTSAGLPEADLSLFIHIMWNINRVSMFGQVFTEIDRQRAEKLMIQILGYDKRRQDHHGDERQAINQRMSVTDQSEASSHTAVTTATPTTPAVDSVPVDNEQGSNTNGNHENQTSSADEQVTRLCDSEAEVTSSDRVLQHGDEDEICDADDSFQYTQSFGDDNRNGDSSRQENMTESNTHSPVNACDNNGNIDTSSSHIETRRHSLDAHIPHEREENNPNTTNENNQCAANDDVAMETPEVGRHPVNQSPNHIVNNETSGNNDKETDSDNESNTTCEAESSDNDDDRDNNNAKSVYIQRNIQASYVSVSPLNVSRGESNKDEDLESEQTHIVIDSVDGDEDNEEDNDDNEDSTNDESSTSDSDSSSSDDEDATSAAGATDSQKTVDDSNTNKDKDSINVSDDNDGSEGSGDEEAGDDSDSSSSSSSSSEAQEEEVETNDTTSPSSNHHGNTEDMDDAKPEGSQPQANQSFDDDDLIIIDDIEDSQGLDDSCLAEVVSPSALGREDSDLVMTTAKRSIRCPITQQVMRQPVKNRYCGHVYEAEGADQLIKNRGGTSRCPVPGCSNSIPLHKSHLFIDIDLKASIMAKTKSS